MINVDLRKIRVITQKGPLNGGSGGSFCKGQILTGNRLLIGIKDNLAGVCYEFMVIVAKLGLAVPAKQ